MVSVGDFLVSRPVLMPSFVRLPRLPNIKRWMEEESMHKKKEPFDFSGWNTLCAEDCPQQHNGFGVEAKAKPGDVQI